MFITIVTYIQAMSKFLAYLIEILIMRIDYKLGQWLIAAEIIVHGKLLG